ncbi:MAG TPA: hypothetical protein VI603_04765, partial [Saprospiraceae bacterium]|nr:hypothetical protein [Saprospiraceae bacterium]
KVLSLMDALKKMTLLPAQRLESISPQLINKGRIRVGADADITMFDPDRIIDKANYANGGNVPSEGVVYVMVGGVFVVKDRRVLEGVFPGKAILSRTE